MVDIFLSYNEQDRDAARRVVALLETGGWSVWWDRRVPAGETWRAVLDRALADMKCMVVLWSRRSVESEWVCEEASEARRLGRLVPVMIEPVRPPAGFREIQAADLTGWDGSVTHPSAEALLADIKSRLVALPSDLYSNDPPLKPVPSTGSDEYVRIRRQLLAGPAPLELTRLRLKLDALLARDPNSIEGRELAALIAAAQRIDARPAAIDAPPPAARQRLRASRTWLWLAAIITLVAAGALALWMTRPPPPVPRAATGTDASRPAPAIEGPAAEPARIDKPVTIKTPALNTTPVTTSSDPHVLPENVRRSVPPSNKTKVGASSARCSALLERLQLGEPLSDSDRAVQQKECLP
jgi:TIR domain